MVGNVKTQSTVVRNTGIDWLKALAVILVMNSHMNMCYPKFGFLASGGAIGDALFFFVSGFTLFLGRHMRFDNWYKRRISRIYPSIIATAIIVWLLWNNTDSIGDILLGKRYWFIGCILVYYVLLYPIKTLKNGSYASHCMIIGAVISVLLYFLFFNNEKPFYAGSFFRCIAFFLIMLQGAIMGKSANNYRFQKKHVFFFFLSIGLFYCFFYLGNHNALILLSFASLFGVTRYGYLMCSAPLLEKLYHNKYICQIVYIISQCCLEVYLIQKYVFTKSLNDIFPLNIVIIMIAVLLMAYIVKVVAELILQTFKTEPYEWKKMLLWKRNTV